VFPQLRSRLPGQKKFIARDFAKSCFGAPASSSGPLRRRVPKFRKHISAVSNLSFSGQSLKRRRGALWERSASLYPDSRNCKAARTIGPLSRTQAPASPATDAVLCSQGVISSARRSAKAEAHGANPCGSANFAFVPPQLQRSFVNSHSSVRVRPEAPTFRWSP
jgi:hypothetical protein